MTVAAALVHLRRLGYTFRVCDGRLQVRRPTPEPPETAEALAVLRAHPDEAADLLAWPEGCVESEARFGHPVARLYPFLRFGQPGEPVRTPHGHGRLLQVLDGEAVVDVDGERVLRVPAAEVRPARDAGRVSA